MKRAENKTITEILDEVASCKTKNERIEKIRSNECNCIALRDILKLNFDSSVELDLPEGAPPYKKVDLEKNELSLISNLHVETGKLRYVLKNNATTNKVKKELIFQKILESIPPDDAELLIAAKDRSIKKKWITHKFVKEAFPNLIKSDEEIVKINPED